MRKLFEDNNDFHQKIQENINENSKSIMEVMKIVKLNQEDWNKIKAEIDLLKSLTLDLTDSVNQRCKN